MMALFILTSVLGSDAWKLADMLLTLVISMLCSSKAASLPDQLYVESLQQVVRVSECQLWA